ncbi:hypothetical protein [Pseudomonas sp. 25 E 4]|nr:hypothetical protein [Pseudomonas sp. 25 E 4]
MQGLAAREVAGGGIERAQQSVAFARRQNRQLVQRGSRAVFQGADQLLHGVVHVATQPLRADLRHGQHAKAEACAQVIDAQHQRVVTAFFAAQQLHTFPDALAVAGHFPGSAVTVIEQRAEQRRRIGHAAATLGQGQRRVFMAEQRAQAGVGGLDRHRRARGHIDAQRQGVDEHAQRAVGAVAGLHAAHQHGAEHHVVAPRHQPQHLGPRQVHQAGGTDAQLPRLLTHALSQRGVEGQLGLFDSAPVALHVLHAKRQGRLIDVGEHFAEELLMLGGAHAQARLGHVVAKWRRLGQRIGLVEQERPHFLAHHFHGGVVQRQVMEQQDRRHAVIGRVLGVDHAQQRRLGNVQAVMPCIESPVQLRDDVAVRRVQTHMLHHQLRLAPHHLHRVVQTFPDHRGAQDIVARDDLLQSAHEAVQTLKAVERHARLQQVRIALLGADVVVENAFLQRRQRVDILHIRRTAGNACDDALDGRRVELHQAEHRRCDLRAARRDAIGRHHDFPSTAHGGSQRGQSRLAEQHAHIGTQAHLAHALDQAHGQQRMPAQLEEVVMATDLGHL